MKVLTIFSLALLLAPFADAQSVSFRGQVEDVQGTANQFRLDCTNTQLTSFAFDLNQFMDQSVSIQGNWNGSVVAPSVQVTAITPVVETYEIGGGAKIGELSLQGFTAAPGSLAIGIISRGTAFVPFQGTNGVIFLDPGQIALTQTGVVGGAGLLEIPFLIPNDNALIGVEMFGQGALLNAGQPILITNSDCKTISN